MDGVFFGNIGGLLDGYFPFSMRACKILCFHEEEKKRV